MGKKIERTSGISVAGKMIAFLLILSLFSTASFALGIRPAKSELLLVEGTAASSFVVVNNEDRDQAIKVYVEGPYSQLVTILEPTFVVPAGGERIVSYVLNATDLVVGTFNIYSSPEAGGGEGFGATVRIAHRVNFREAEAIVPSGAASAVEPPLQEVVVNVPEPAPQPAEPQAQPQSASPASEPFDLATLVLAGGVIVVLGAFELWLRSRKRRY